MFFKESSKMRTGFHFLCVQLGKKTLLTVEACEGSFTARGTASLLLGRTKMWEKDF